MPYPGVERAPAEERAFESVVLVLRIIYDVITQVFVTFAVC